MDGYTELGTIIESLNLTYSCAFEMTLFFLFGLKN